MSLSLIDIVSVVILTYNIMRGMVTGLIRTSVGALAVILAFYVSWQFGDAPLGIIDSILPVGFSFGGVIRHLILWVLTFGIISLVGVAIRWMIRLQPLLVVDRILGAFFGFLVGASLLATPLVLLTHFPLLQQVPYIQEALKQSLAAKLLAPTVQFLLEHGLDKTL